MPPRRQLTPVLKSIFIFRTLTPNLFIVVGLGEIIGGLAFGIFGTYLNRFIGRSPRVVLGFVCHIAAFVIALINLPFDSPTVET